jgi:hypothetical protein
MILHRYRLMSFIILLFLSMSHELLPNESKGSLKASVYAIDLESGTQIIGLIGIPLGELATVKAKIVASDSKETDRYVEVITVNNNRLPRSIRLTFSIWQWGNLLDKDIPFDKELVLRVYETGGMVGIPPAAIKETIYVNTVGWAFRTSLVLLYEQR